MDNHLKKAIPGILAAILLISLSCNAPLTGATGSPAAPPANPNPASTTGPELSPTERTGTPEAPVSTVAPINHLVTPPDIAGKGPLNYDVDSTGTGPENRAPYGDSYNIDLFERPFTQNVMNYIPALDIYDFILSQDDTWYYVTMEMSGGDMNDHVGINYGVELDTDRDGIGDYLIWAYPPYTPTWTTDTVRVYSDPNHDVGGASPEKSDANATTSAPYPGDGYETMIFNQGQGNDPDLAWVRLDPHVSSAVQFAFKQSLAGPAFMWGVWADAGLRDPGKFNYNDRFTYEQAGSPIKGNVNYPIKAIYQVDNTCWAAFGFKPTGFEPHLCPPLAPQPTKQPKPGPTFYLPPPAICTCSTCPWLPQCVK